VKHAQQRGRDSSGLVIHRDGSYEAYRADYPIGWLLKRTPDLGHLFFGHSRLVTNGTGDNQPVMRDNVVVIHNGIVVNEASIWKKIGKQAALAIDTETIPAIIDWHLSKGGSVESAGDKVLELAEGIVACAALVPAHGKLLLFSNNGSLYIGEIGGGTVF